MGDVVRVALAGLGTVGAGVIKLIDANRSLIERRAGRPIEIVAVSARDRNRDRGVDLGRFEWVDDSTALATHPGVDVVVELIGGSDGPALVLARNSIAQGRAFVTANKAMIAHHGLELAGAAETANVPFKYEAAVAGGIPVIKGLREGAAANEISGVFGILNGTCNYILSTMESAGRDFADVLAEAQALGLTNCIFAGPQPNGPDLIGCLDVMVLPSRFEGLGLVLLEAMVRHTPIIGSMGGAIPEITEQGKLARLFPVGDVERLVGALRDMQQNESTRQSLADMAFARAQEKYTVDAMVAATSAFYKKAAVA